MKLHHHHNHRRQAFTLIELLVVIGIIALLASIAVPAGNIVLKKARAVQARAMMKGLEVAIKGYQTEYNRYPAAPTGGGDADIALSDGNTLLAALVVRGTTGAAASNPRAIAFYDPPPAKGAAGSYTAGYTPGGGLVDPWGGTFVVTIDYDDDGEVAIPAAAAGANDAATIATGVVAYSLGPAPHDPEKDIVRSWR